MWGIILGRHAHCTARREQAPFAALRRLAAAISKAVLSRSCPAVGVHRVEHRGEEQQHHHEDDRLL